MVTVRLSPQQAREVLARQAAFEHYVTAILHGTGVTGLVTGVADTPDGPVLTVQPPAEG